MHLFVNCKVNEHIVGKWLWSFLFCFENNKNNYSLTSRRTDGAKKLKFEKAGKGGAEQRALEIHLLCYNHS